MIKITNNRSIVYNANGLIITLRIPHPLSENIYDLEFFKNDKNLTNEDIIRSLGKPLGVKDKIEVAYKNSIFNKHTLNDIAFSGKIWRAIDIDTLIETSPEHINQIFNCVTSSFNKNKIGTIYKSLWILYCTSNEIKSVIANLEQLEIQQKELNNQL